MADTTPRQNQCAVDLGILLDDATSGADNGIAAAADGTWATAARKNHYLHAAYRWLVDQLVFRFGIEDASEMLNGLIATQSITFSSSGTTVNADFLYPVRLVNSTLPVFKYGRKADFTLDTDIELSKGYSIEGTLLYGWIRSAGTLTLQSSGSATLYYLKADRVSSSTGSDTAPNTAPDITLDRRWHDVCVLYAASQACLDKSIIDSAPEWRDKGGRFLASALEKLPNARPVKTHS